MSDPVQAVSAQPISEQAPAPVPTPPRPHSATPHEQRRELVEADLLIEDVSIDGMCGVY